jgi:hypothetical protein
MLRHHRSLIYLAADMFDHRIGQHQVTAPVRERHRPGVGHEERPPSHNRVDIEGGYDPPLGLDAAFNHILILNALITHCADEDHIPQSMLTHEVSDDASFPRAVTDAVPDHSLPHHAPYATGHQFAHVRILPLPAHKCRLKIRLTDPIRPREALTMTIPTGVATVTGTGTFGAAGVAAGPGHIELGVAPLQ